MQVQSQIQKGVAFLLLALLPVGLRAQVSCNPAFPKVDDNVTITFNAKQGNAALTGVSPVYAHMGVITDQSASASDWKHVTTAWGIADPVGLMTNAGTDLWTKTFNIRTFFNIQAGETVLKLAFVFRNTDGSVVGRANDGSDIFYPVYPDNVSLFTAFITPSAGTFLTTAGTLIPVNAAASLPASLTLYDNGQQVATASGTSLTTNLTAAAGVHTVACTAATATEKDTAQFVYVVPAIDPPQNPPAGTEYGINYVDAQTVRLMLYAPGKQVVHVIGDFNDWQPKDSYQMHRNAIGNQWWIEIGGLQPGQQYRFQYLVDGTLRIADPLSTLVLDPWNDAYIPALTYPNLLPYPSGKTSGIVSVLQTAQPPFNWQASGYTRPKKTDLVVYELLLRDFLARHDYPTLLDTLDYLQNLGITAIELMPVNEFEGNSSWGYNPDFHKALDKYYGTAEDFKRFVDACHQRNIAVVLDVVFNHVTGLSPLAQLYWDAAQNRPAANNPWLNPIAKHDFNVFNDFNHESALTKIYVKNCLKYWLSEFKVDGFRFDLSKGFTQKNTLGNVNAWGQYDASRVAIWKDYANAIWSTDPTAYIILEHFADNTEEKDLAEYGMMLWGNMNGAYKEVGLGFTAGINTDLSWISYKQRGWSVPHVVGYMESHDEERIGYQCITYGNSANASYNVKSPIIALRREEMLANLLYAVPGPKMLWEFGELGYDYSINTCTNGTIANNCRLDPKPIRWDFTTDPYRHRLHDVIAALLHLRSSYDLFETTDFQLNLGAGAIRSIYLNGSGMHAVLVANVGTASNSATLNFQHTGDWYEYYTGKKFTVPDPAVILSLQPGEYRLYLDQQVPLPPGLDPTPVTEASGGLSGLELYPNPVQGLFSVDFSLEAGTVARAEVFDVTGRRVVTLWSGSLSAGTHHFQGDSSSWAPGFYWLSVTDAQGGRLVRKMVK